MSDVMSFAKIDEQRVELLPARTVLSMFSTGEGWNHDDHYYHDDHNYHDEGLLGLGILGL